MTHRPFDRIAHFRGGAALLGLLSLLVLVADARGQPADPWSTDPQETGQPSDDRAAGEDAGEGTGQGDQDAGPTGDRPAGVGLDPREAPAGQPGPEGTSEPADPYQGYANEEEPEQPTEEPEPIPVVLPNLFNAPTGRLLTAGLIFGSATVDTGGGLSGELRAGLGDVAEFGLEITDLIRARTTPDEDSDRIWPYVLATFKMGLAEDLLFDQQPALALGFRKSFAREADEHRSRVAELYLVATKSLGDKVAIHIGGAFWDAELKPTGEDPILFHGRGWRKQLRPFGGIEIEPLPDAKILLETFWVPEFYYDATPHTTLVPNFAWGVRYEATDWVLIESGVRIPDINEVNLIDAQIFGQLSFVSRTLARAIKKSRKKR